MANKIKTTSLGHSISTALKKGKTLRQAKNVILYCTACTRTFTVFKKIEGKIAEQQVCPHIILRKVNMS